MFLRFSTQFTGNSQSTFTIGVTNCREALEKKLAFAMWPLGRPAGAAPVKFRPGPPEFGRGRVGRRSRAH
jgi:hypothetical protein